MIVEDVAGYRLGPLIGEGGERLRALAKSADDRFPDMEQLARALADGRSTPPSPATADDPRAHGPAVALPDGLRQTTPSPRSGLSVVGRRRAAIGIALAAALAGGAAVLFLMTRRPATATVTTPAPLDAATIDREAKKACATGRIQQGVDLLADYYARTSNPTAIYNQGRCYQQNDMPNEAPSRFREFLRVGHRLPPERRQLAERQIAELEAEIQHLRPKK